MHVQPIDPRDTDIEIDRPTYRVFFWERPRDERDSGLRSDEYEIADAQDVHEVMEWAEANAGGRTLTVYVVVDNSLIRLAGQDPTTTK